MLVALATLAANTAHAQEDPEATRTPSSPRPIPTHPVPRPPPPPPRPLTATPLDDHLQTPPQQPVAVPTPSPVVLGGVPTEPGTAAKPLRWNRARFSTADTVIMLSGGALTLATAIIQPQPRHVRGPVLFDETIRDAVRAPSVQARYTFRDVSDVGLSFAATWPFFVDALITAWWLRGSRDVAEQMALLGLETLAVSGAVQGVTNTLVSRQRPYGSGCGDERDGLPANAIDCTSSSHYRSFFSGHAAFSFTSAALICLNHIEFELLGKPWDTISCAGAYGVAATTASFRVVSDMHYASDILTGALVGSLVGWGVPYLHSRRPDAATFKTGGLKVRIVPSAGGAGVVGIF
jgi:membrane-associated phospholipid phosphatase